MLKVRKSPRFFFEEFLVIKYSYAENLWCSDFCVFILMGRCNRKFL